MKQSFILSIVRWLLGFLNLDKNPAVGNAISDMIAANLAKKAIMIPIGHKNTLLLALSVYVKEQLKAWAAAKTYSTQELYENRIIEATAIVSSFTDEKLVVPVSMKFATTFVTIRTPQGDGDYEISIAQYWTNSDNDLPYSPDIEFQIGK